MNPIPQRPVYQNHILCKLICRVRGLGCFWEYINNCIHWTLLRYKHNVDRGNGYDRPLIAKEMLCGLSEDELLGIKSYIGP